MKSNLSPVENVVYFSFWIFISLYSLYKLVEAQTGILEKYPELKHELRDLNPGWKFVSRLKDDSDVEWSVWKYIFAESWLYMIMQFFVSEILRRTYTHLLKYWYIISSVIFILSHMGIKQMLIILAQPLIYTLIVFTGGKRTSIWVTSILLLATYNSLKYKYYFWNMFDSTYMEEEVYIMLYATGWIELRCISFCLDYVEKAEKASDAEHKTVNQGSVYENFINMYSYVLYLPVLFVGPIILYEEFEKSFHVKNENLYFRIKSFLWDMMLFKTYTFLLDLSFHYIYFYAMQSQLWTLQELPSVALCGGGLWMGLEFHVKYVISYGTTAAYSRLDNIDPPPTPRCIARIHVYSHMWRYFDVGLYRFLVKYIYKPVFSILTKNIIMSKLNYKLISSLTTFIFIFLWHGTWWNIFVWSVLNYGGIVLETIGRAISKTDKYKEFKTHVLKTDAMEVRFIAFLCAPLLCLSAISGFHLFAGTDVANLYFHLMKGPSLSNCILAYFSFYCVCQVAIALEDFPSRTDVREIKKKDCIKH